MKRIAWIIIICTSILKGQDIDSTLNRTPQLHGYLKGMEQVSFTDLNNDVYYSSLLHNRLNFKWTPFQHWLMRVELRNRIFYGDQVRTNRSFMKTVGEDPGAVNLSQVWVDEKAFGFQSIIDRALLNYSNKHFDVTVGRQRINWGLNMVWNPNDIFNIYNYFDFDYEERPGSDAARIQYNWGGFSSVEFAAKLGKEKNDHTAAFLLKGNKFGYDYQGLFGVYKTDLVLGAGWAGNIKDAGFKGEFSYFRPYENLTDTTGSLSSSISFDYSLKNGLYMHLSGYYNSEGKEDLSLLSSQLLFTANPKQLLPFKYTGFIQLSKQITPLFTVGLSNMYSPSKNTWAIIPSLQYSLASNWELMLLSQSFFTDINSVYRNLNTSVFLRIKWSF